MRSRSFCMPICGRRLPCGQGDDCGATPSTSRGTANTFCGVEPKAGRHFTKATPDRSSPEFADYLLEIAERYPAAETIHLVMDNLSSHRRKAVVQR
jgi:DDE superfamily endonuclease